MRIPVYVLYHRVDLCMKPSSNIQLLVATGGEWDILKLVDEVCEK